MICSSGIGFDPRVGGKRLTFGFEGIWQGTAVLYDHQTKSLWMHFTGACFDGVHDGTVLQRLPTGRHTTWADWRRLHPRTSVLARDQRFMNMPGGDGYFPRAAARSGQPVLPPDFPSTIQTRDPRLKLHDLLYGVVVDDTPRAYPFRDLGKRPVIEERVGKTEITVWFDTGSRSAAAFLRSAGEKTFSFEAISGGRRRDKETQSVWTMDGICVEGRSRGTRLTPVHGLMTEWYGWYANYPKTSLWKP